MLNDFVYMNMSYVKVARTGSEEGGRRRVGMGYSGVGDGREYPLSTPSCNACVKHVDVGVGYKLKSMKSLSLHTFFHGQVSKVCMHESGNIYDA